MLCAGLCAANVALHALKHIWSPRLHALAMPGFVRLTLHALKHIYNIYIYMGLTTYVPGVLRLTLHALEHIWAGWLV